MKQLEIIHLRSSGEALDSLGHRIRESLGAEHEKTEVRLYRRPGLETDLAVHIHHLEEPGREKSNGLALQLAAALRSFGIVDHTLWEELK